MAWIAALAMCISVARGTMLAHALLKFGFLCRLCTRVRLMHNYPMHQSGPGVIVELAGQVSVRRHETHRLCLCHSSGMRFVAAGPCGCALAVVILHGLAEGGPGCAGSWAWLHEQSRMHVGQIFSAAPVVIHLPMLAHIGHAIGL